MTSRRAERLKGYLLSTVTGGLFLISSVLALAGTGGDGKTIDVQKLFETKCSECHGLSNPRGERHDRKGWVTVLERMKSNGCDLSDSEVDLLSEYLAKELGT